MNEHALTSWNREGVTLRLNTEAEHSPSETRSGQTSERALILGQLEDEGYVTADGSSSVLSWSDLFRVARSAEYAGSLQPLGLPPIEAWRPSLTSRGTLTDVDFSVVVSGWYDPEGRRPTGNVEINGAVITAGGRCSVLPMDVWLLLEAIRTHRGLPVSMRGPDANRRAWADIREHARSSADLSDFLRKTVVLTPQRLRLELRKGDRLGNKLIEVLPDFDGAPERWLEFFDRTRGVPDRYEIPDGQGIVHVLLSPEVRTVLQELRRMPGRRIAGERAEAFIRNPFSVLGPSASSVIDAGQFEAAREAAGISFARFTSRVRRSGSEQRPECELVIEESLKGIIHSSTVTFRGPDDIEKFLAKIEGKIEAEAQCCHWEGYDLEILGDTPDQVARLRLALVALRESRRVKISEIFDLSQYSDRVEGFGVEKPYYSPFIARKTDEAGWFPENVAVGLCFKPKSGSETVAVVLDDQALKDFRDEVKRAELERRESFAFPCCPEPVPTRWAVEALDTIDRVGKDIKAKSFNPEGRIAGNGASKRAGLVVKPNVDSLDYEEHRGALSRPQGPPQVPAALLPSTSLKEHQSVGVAWLQHLWRRSPSACRGALLADDMGLGKTIQLLVFIASVIEEDPGCEPFLVVAPVSLLENWKEEIAKFFVPGSIDVLTLYGAELTRKRLPRAELEAALSAEGITRLLAPGWLGTAKVVLTTYETLRDLEFSLARQRWSAMVCDEAQKIKNPNALVTRSAKKQNARLKIACTGTPVENTLTDIWCLFDFIQPGLLGALKDFGERYRRPIEAQTEEERARIGELRELIEPQKLRRMKTEVAKDLPRKIEVDSCRALPLSARQRLHYANAVASFRQQDGEAKRTGLQSPLGLLQYLRRLCSDPRAPGAASTDAESVSDIELHSPKMRWLVTQLHSIEARAEKAIIFCEFRDLQRTLQRVVGERFGFLPDVINGDTTAQAGSINNRQRRIKKFQQSPGFGVIVLSPLAVGFGVNIQAANHVIHFTRTWNPAKEDQATDRAYRIGQDKDVFVYYPVVVADDFMTFDAKLDKLLERKRALATDMLNGAGDLRPADFADLEAPDGGRAFEDGLDGDLTVTG